MSTTTRPRRPRWALRLAALTTAALLAAPLTAVSARAETAPPTPSSDAAVSVTATPSPAPDPIDVTPTPGPATETAAAPETASALAATAAPEPEEQLQATVALSEGEQAIAAKYSTSASVLGQPIGPVYCGLTGGGCYRPFQQGDIHWSPATGAHWTHYGIRTKWGSTGWEEGILGYPRTDEICGLTGGGCYQSFQKGDIHWSPATGAHWTHYGIRTKWGSTGWEEGILGYPRTDEICGLTGGGCYQSFQKGDIHWSPATGAHWTHYGIRTKWGSTGWENGSLGYPRTDEICGLVRGGCYQSFQGGDIHWSAASGAHWTSGQLRTMWGQRGYENGRYGYPVGDPFSVSGKTSQRFEGGYLTTGVDTRCLTGRTMCASKNDRKLRWMINGQIVQTMDARFGCSATPTDNGEFKVYWKSYNHTSTLYNTWMPRAMFYNGGEAVHYSPDFASRGYAGCSHGCVNIRDWDGINWLYNQVQVGDKVVVYY